MKTNSFERLWRFIYRAVISLAAVFIVLAIYVGIGMQIPHVRESAGFTALSPEAESDGILAAERA